MAESTNVKVAVRVRPFNDREKSRNSQLIITMTGGQTEIKDPDNPKTAPKKFAFDYSYWSHDGFKENKDGYLDPAAPKYADQRKVFEDLGRGVLQNAWKGYNTSLFAYGQTGSGKSYSMVGYGANKGIVPVACEELFKEIEAKRKGAGEGEDYKVEFTMLEIYNEQVRDLLNYKNAPKGGLKVRQHATKGFYVEGLRSCNVNTYKEIDAKMNEGTKNRTVAATNMNATSSRAHTIVALSFTQKTMNEAKQSMTRSSVINLVDLAGSERATSTGATGDRLKEGANINQSLSTLGNCIKALADQGAGKKGATVPFRDSVLTKLLKNALGGNSKTIMIAALSPADINYDETLSTLRFADRAKAIKTQAVVNESPTDKLIRELREENQRLIDMLKKGGSGAAALLAGDGGAGGGTEVEEMKRAMEELARENDDQLERMKQSYEERLKGGAKESEATTKATKKEEEDKKAVPHLWNLNEDPSLTGMIVHFCRKGKTTVGNQNASPAPSILFQGLSIQKEHAVIENKDNTVTLTPKDGAAVKINGDDVKKQVILHHNDRLLIGNNHLYVFHHPQDFAKQQKKGGGKITTPTFNDAQEEIASKSGMMIAFKPGQKASKEDLLLHEDLVQMIPMLNEANAISEELDKKKKFDVALVSPQARGLKSGRTEVQVKMKDMSTGNEWMWDRDKFINRKFLMQEMYQNYIDGDKDWDLPREKDPFWEPADSEQLVGSVHVYLQSLAYMIEMQENLTITDFRGTEQGILNVEVAPCDDKWRDLEDEFVENPSELVGKPLYFKVKIPHARGIPKKFDKTQCRYKFYLDDATTQTKEVAGINPNYAFETQVTFKTVTQQLVDYLNSQPLVIDVWGKQKEEGDQRQKGTTKELMTREKTVIKPAAKGKPPGPSRNESEKMQVELATTKKRAERAEAKLAKLQKMVDEAKKKKQANLKVADVEACLRSSHRFKAVARMVLETEKAKKEHLGKVTSKACSIQ